MINLFCIHPKGLNVGNEAIHLGLRHLLYQGFGQVVNIISVPAVSHYESVVRAGLTARTVHEINQYGHGVIVGGGNLYENGELSVDANALKALEPPLMLFSLSRGRIYNRKRELVARTDCMPPATIKALNDRADFSLARDHATLEYLKSIGCDRAELGGCPTVYLDRIADQLPKLPTSGERPVLISIRTPSLMNVPLDLQAKVRTIVEQLIGRLQKLDMGPVKLLCHDHRDLTFAASFVGSEYIYTGDVYAYLALLQTAALNVSFRLHATLPSLTLGNSSLKISYDERALSLMSTLGLDDWNTNLVTSENVVEEILAKVARLDSLESSIAAVKSNWTGFYKSNLETMRQFAERVRAFAADRP